MLIELAFAALLSGRPGWAASAPDSAAVSASPAGISRLGEADISGGWKLRGDPLDGGMIAKWHTPRVDDSKWTHVSDPWEGVIYSPAKKGAKARDKKGPGRYWIRNTISIPVTGPRRLFLSLSHPGESMDVFINGTLLAKDIPGGAPSIREITRLMGTGEEFLLAMRIRKSRTPTGMGSVRIILSDDSRLLFPGRREWISFLARENPELSWPAWALGKPVKRAPVGLPGSLAPAFVGGEGQLVPPSRSFAVSCWVYEEATKKFLAPGFMPCTFSLDERVLPIPEVTVAMGRFNMYLRFWADSLEDDPGTTLAVGEVTVANLSDRTRSVELFIAAHPLLPWEEPGPEGGFLGMTKVEHDPESRAIIVDGKPAVILTTPADYFVAAPFTEGTVARSAANGITSPASATDSAMHMASGAAVYRLKIQPFGARTMTFRVFLSGAPGQATPEFTQSIRDINRKWSQKENLNEWRRLLVGKERFFLRIPDKKAQDAFYASIGHLLAGHGTGKRGDAAVLAKALEQAGHHEFAVKLLEENSPSSTLLASAIQQSDGGTFRPDSMIRGIAGLSATEPASAVPVMEKALKRMAAPGAFAWAEVEDEATGRWVGGEMPGLSAAAEYILLMRGMLIHDDGDFVELVPAVPPSWLKPGSQVEVKNAPTRHGPVSFAVTARESGFVVNLNQAPSAPGGCRWRVPGKKRIGKVVVDGRGADIPADRIVVFPPGVKRVAVVW